MDMVWGDHPHIPGVTSRVTVGRLLTSGSKSFNIPALTGASTRLLKTLKAVTIISAH